MRKPRKGSVPSAHDPSHKLKISNKTKGGGPKCFGCMTKPAGLIWMPGKPELTSIGFCSIRCAAVFGARTFENAKLRWDDEARLWIAQDNKPYPHLLTPTEAEAIAALKEVLPTVEGKGANHVQ